jgi:hypothetical protein
MKKFQPMRLPAAKPRNVFARLASVRIAGRPGDDERRRSERGARPVRDEIEEWLHEIRSAGM